ncbi:hypothetical protein SDC9_149516 [bioreactor metagenome]|uniref:Uncharacterized protein n=1 Tax=bioreactor metagenome TaxID=1076179 RepID=A0A645ELR2_9ZZZZ
MVIPLENHLIELKETVYASAYKNDVKDFELADYVLEEKKELQYEIALNCHEDIANLFSMTPYYYKTSRDDQMKLDDICQMSVSAEFAVLIYRKR